MESTFDLRRISPPKSVPVTFRDGQTFRLSGDPDTDDVVLMLRIESEINDVAGAELASVLEEGKEAIQRIILAADSSQDVAGLKVTTEEMLVVFALLVHGTSVAEAVGAAISAANEADAEMRDGETPEERAERLAAAEVAEPGPLSQSASSSSERSSGSAAEEASLLATG